MQLSLGEIFAMVVANITCEQFQDEVFAAIHARGNRSLEYVEFKIANAREYEQTSNYGAW